MFSQCKSTGGGLLKPFVRAQKMVCLTYWDPGVSGTQFHTRWTANPHSCRSSKKLWFLLAGTVATAKASDFFKVQTELHTVATAQFTEFTGERFIGISHWHVTESHGISWDTMAVRLFGSAPLSSEKVTGSSRPVPCRASVWRHFCSAARKRNDEENSVRCCMALKCSSNTFDV